MHYLSCYKCKLLPYYYLTIVLLVALLSSNTAIAWPYGLNKYFNVVNNQGKSLTISINKDATPLCRGRPSYTSNAEFFLYRIIEEVGPLMITVRDSRTFVITNLGERVTPNHRSLSFMFHLNILHPPIYMSGGETERAKTNAISRNNFIDVSNIFTWRSLEEITTLYNSWSYYFRHIQDFNVTEPSRFVIMPLELGQLSTVTVTGELMPERYIDMCARLTRYIFSPLAASIAMCMNLIYTTKNTKKE